MKSSRIQKLSRLVGDVASITPFLIFVQVFHGAESDIVWLQQDFQVYVVNLFDTYHASKVLGNIIPRHHQVIS